MSNVAAAYHLLVHDSVSSVEVTAGADDAQPDYYFLTVWTGGHHLTISGSGHHLTNLVRELSEALTWTIHEHEATPRALVGVSG